jgi:hypothetical protein
VLLPLVSIGQVCINEMMSSNKSFSPLKNEKTPDWIELYNDSEEILNLNGFKIIFDNDEIEITENISVKAKGFFIFYNDKEFSVSKQYLDFKINKVSGKIKIQNQEGKTIDKVKYNHQRSDISYGREKDGSKKWRYFSQITPGGSNNEKIAYKGFTKSPRFNKKSGYYSKEFSLKIKKPIGLQQIIYSSDGSTPGFETLFGKEFSFKNSYREAPGDPTTPLQKHKLFSYEYTSKLKVTPLSGIQNFTSKFSTTWHKSPVYIPNYNTNQGAVFRAVAVKKNRLPSEVVNRTFIFSETKKNPFSFPIINISIDPSDLFDYNKGIYTAGKVFEDFRNNSFEPVSLCTEGNFSKKGEFWEKSANLTFFDQNQSLFDENIKLRINGGCTRNAPYKALRIYTKNNFNNFDLISKTKGFLQSAIILRNSGNDYKNIFFLDPFVHSIVQNLKVPVQRNQPSILLLNGEYWGIHNIRDRIDNEFLEAKFEVDKDNLDLVKVVWYGPPEIDNGSDSAYKALSNFFATKKMQNSNEYQAATQLIDIENFIDYQIAHIFFGNIDWPQNNVRLWRYRIEDGKPNNKKEADGKWRWIFYDADRSLGETVNFAHNNLNDALNRPANFIFKSLMQNASFKSLFISRFNELLINDFKFENTSEKFLAMKSIYEPEVEKHIKRWKTLPNKQAWQNNCTAVLNYLKFRPQEIKKHLLEISNYNVDSLENLSFLKKDEIHDLKNDYKNDNNFEIKKAENIWISEGLSLNADFKNQNITIKISADDSLTELFFAEKSGKEIKYFQTLYHEENSTIYKIEPLFLKEKNIIYYYLLTKSGIKKKGFITVFQP